MSLLALINKTLEIFAEKINGMSLIASHLQLRPKPEAPMRSLG